MVSLRQLLVPFVDEKRMFAASHCTYCREIVGGVRSKEGGLGGQTLYLQSCVHSRRGGADQ